MERWNNVIAFKDYRQSQKHEDQKIYLTPARRSSLEAQRTQRIMGHRSTRMNTVSLSAAENRGEKILAQRDSFEPERKCP
jgi:hypothetical protein